MSKKVVVTKETGSGRNVEFKDGNGRPMTRGQFADKIRRGEYQGDYHLRDINGVPTPCSNPDKSDKNNLG